MKKYLLLLIACLSLHFISAQYCGNSGFGVCTPSGTLTYPGMAPYPWNLPPLTNGVASTTVIQFKNFDTVRYGTLLLTIDSLHIDSIGNLPAGLCWATSSARNLYKNQEDGCIRLTGTPCASPGQYKLQIFVTAYTPTFMIGPYLDAEQAGMKYYVRMINSGDATIALDTSNNNLFAKLSGYSATASGCASLNLSVNLGTTQTVCNGAHVTLTPLVTGGTAPYSYAWSSTGNSLSCNNCAGPTATITQNSTYHVTVTDFVNATATASITYNIGTASPLQITAITSTTICPGGAVQLDAGLGFTSYHWNNNTTNESANFTGAGSYSVTATAQNGCVYSDTIVINQYNIPALTITPSGFISLCATGGSTTLTAAAGFNNYAWSNGSVLQSTTLGVAGTYTLTATDSHGCSATASKDVNGGVPYNGQTICAVTYDTASGKNLIVWEKDSTQGIDTFKIYRETATPGTYQLIGTQGFSAVSTYLDAGSNPMQASNRYVIKTHDACGESQYSAAHQTMLLTSASGSNYVNLSWNAYAGFSYPNYAVYRGTTLNNMQQITTVTTGTLTYSDQNPPSPPLYYSVQVSNAQGCNPTGTSSDYGVVSSNVLHLLALGINDAEENSTRLFAFYDEGSAVNILRWTNTSISPSQIVLFDVTGREIYKANTIAANQVVLPQTIAGIYIAEMTIGGKLMRTKVAIK